MKYITLEQARDHLRLDDDDADDQADLALKIEAASAMVANYLGAAADFTEDDVPPEVRAATLLMAAYLYRYRDQDPGYVYGYLPTPVTSILYPLRSPSCA